MGFDKCIVQHLPQTLMKMGHYFYSRKFSFAPSFPAKNTLFSLEAVTVGEVGGKFLRVFIHQWVELWTTGGQIVKRQLLVKA